MRIAWQMEHTSDQPMADWPELLVGFVFQDAGGERVDMPWLNRLCQAKESALPGLGDVRAAKDELNILHPVNWPVPRIAFAGLGKVDPADADAPTVPGGLEDRVRAAAAVSVSKARDLRLSCVGMSLDSLYELAAFSTCDPLRVIREALFGALTGLYRYSALKTDSDIPKEPSALVLIGEKIAGLDEVVALATAEAEAVCLARELVNTPANLLCPQDLVAAAERAAQDLPLTCTVLGRGRLEAIGMGALLSVAHGSAHDPALVCLEYAPAGHEEDKPLVLIGKGLTFDSGGISLKPAAGMQDMKSDMAGAAAVLAAMTVLGKIGGNRRVIGIMACAENMPDAHATRPGDVVTSLSGKTIEIINTDAEGRLVLCDALTYAQQQWEPEALVDVATLTGACIVALGPDVAGVFGTNDGLVERIMRLGSGRGEWFWRLPAWDCYFENLKSSTADMVNAGSREGGSCSAAVFLKQFVKRDVAWAHLDIAGPSYIGSKTPGRAAGGTGCAVRTLAALALS